MAGSAENTSISETNAALFPVGSQLRIWEHSHVARAAIKHTIRDGLVASDGYHIME
jgi:hypothetical protein